MYLKTYESIIVTYVMPIVVFSVITALLTI